MSGTEVGLANEMAEMIKARQEAAANAEKGGDEAEDLDSSVRATDNAPGDVVSLARAISEDVQAASSVQVEEGGVKGVLESVPTSSPEQRDITALPGWDLMYEAVVEYSDYAYLPKVGDTSVMGAFVMERNINSKGKRRYSLKVKRVEDGVLQEYYVCKNFSSWDFVAFFKARHKISVA